MKYGTALACMVAVVCAAPAVARALTIDDVISLAEAGVSEDVLLDEIRKSGQTFTLSEADQARLRKAGVSEKVIGALQGKKPADIKAEADARRAAEQAREQERKRAAADKQAREAAEEAERQRLAREASELGGEPELEGRARDVDELIEQAYGQLDGGDAAGAARAFDRVVYGRLAAPNSASFVDASYGLAEALSRLGLPSAAAPHIVEVLRHGPDAPRYDESLRLLARWAATVDYTHPILELLDTHDLSARTGQAGEDLRDEHAFLVGGYRARFGDHDRARTRLGQVRAEGPRGPAAAYRIGLVEVAAGKPLDGLRAFERAVELAERRGDHEVRDLAYLALARIAYEVGRFDAAIDYYKRIPAGSASRARARYELVWAQLLSGDAAGALAAMHVVESDRYAGDLFSIDLGVVEAIIYLDLCQYDLARARAAAFVTASAPLTAWLERVVELPAADAYKQALADPTGRVMLLSDIDTHVAASAAFAVTLEKGRLLALADDLGEAAQRITPVLTARRQALVDQAAAAALRRLRAARLELADLTVNADEVTVEADLAEREELYGDDKGDEARKTRATWRAPAIADDQATWEVDDERWLDEEDDVKSFVVSVCPAEPAEKK